MPNDRQEANKEMWHIFPKRAQWITVASFDQSRDPTGYAWSTKSRKSF